MARVTPNDVREILDAVMTDDQFRAFIAPASLMVDRHLAAAGYSVAELFELERWLTAHMVAALKKPLKSESVGGASDSYDTVVGFGLDGTFYGQQVKVMDSRGILAGIGRRRAEVTWIGR